MRIAIVGPGLMSIPPKGWGAVEILIWDYKQILERLGHIVHIVNTQSVNTIIDECDSFKADFVHIQYDKFWSIADKLKCPNVAITSHFGYLDRADHPDASDYFRTIFKGFLTLQKARIFALSPSIREVYVRAGFDPKRVSVVPNGVRGDLLTFSEDCLFPERSIYLARIDRRKRQSQFTTIPSVYFAGNQSDRNFTSSRYLGEWSKNTVYSELTNYANLILLSDGEAHPLVCLEAMAAGLGVVVSEWASANLDTSLPFIDVVPEDSVCDVVFVNDVLADNRRKSVKMRSTIRDYCIRNFSWDHVVKNVYLPLIEEVS